MGLDVSHDAWSGGYSAFNRFRQAVAWAAGGIFPHYDPDSIWQTTRLADLGLTPPTKEARLAEFCGEPYQTPAGVADPKCSYLPDAVTRDTYPGLYVFLGHSDCDGEISPDDCVKVADDLERLLPVIDGFPDPATGHIEWRGGYRAVLQRFIDGCRRAAAANEPLDFH